MNERAMAEDRRPADTGASPIVPSTGRPLVSVIIPAYNQAAFLGAAIQSVLGQTYTHLELIVVSDASPDETSDVVKGFADRRVRLVEHERNRGLPAARNTGIREASGEIIALLDADDVFHREKLASHVEFLGCRRDVAVTYNARFNLHHSSTAVRDVWRPPLEVGLADFALGWPFSPSDMVMRRGPLFRVGLFDERLFSGGEDVDLPCRLALEGCRCASVNRALNYRRHHSGRRRRRLPARLQDYRDAVDRALDDPRCPQSVRELRFQAYTNHYLELLFLAFVQHERDLGQAYVREAIRLSPALLAGEPCRLMRYLLEASIADESVHHEDTLQEVLAQMPPECDRLRQQVPMGSEIRVADQIHAGGVVGRGSLRGPGRVEVGAEQR